MSFGPLISVIIPVYNKEQLISKCINSILKQTYSNIEIIIVNDGSTDESRSIIDRLAESDSRIKKIHKVNEGVSSARNVGIDLAKGKYACFIDPDDWVEETYIEELLIISEKYKVDISMVSAKVVLDGRLIENHFFSETGFIDNERGIMQLYDSTYQSESGEFIDVGVPWGKMYLLDFIKKYNLKFNIKLLRNQDNIFNLYAFYYANKMYYKRTPLYYYNYDNFGDYGIKYMENGIEVFEEYAKESLVFHKNFYTDRADLYQLLLRKLASTFMTILSRTIFNPNNEMVYKQRYLIIKNLSEKSVFSHIFEKSNFNNIIEKKNIRLVLNLIKEKRYKTLALIYKLKFFIRKRQI